MEEDTFTALDAVVIPQPKRAPVPKAQTKVWALPVQEELFEPAEITRPELNIARMASHLFISPKARNVRETRTYSWSASIEGQELEASIVVRPLDGACTLTTTSYRVFLALVQIWEQSGQPEDGRRYDRRRDGDQLLPGALEVLFDYPFWGLLVIGQRVVS